MEVISVLGFVCISRSQHKTYFILQVAIVTL
jgi:hypothetical protein